MARVKRALVLNHNAVPPNHGGLTRTGDLFSGLTGWSYLILSASTTEGIRSPLPPRFGFKSIWASPYRKNGYTRILNWFTYALGALAEGSRQKCPDVIYASSPHPLVGPVAVALGKRFGVPVAFEVRDLWPEILESMGATRRGSLQYRAMDKLVKATYASADVIVVLAEGVASYLDSTIPGHRIELIPNSVVVPTLMPKSDRSALREELGLDGLVAIYAGAHGPANGLDRLLDAAAEFEGSEWTFLLVGQGIEKPRLTRRVKDEGLSNVVFSDPIPKADIYRLLQVSDVGIHLLADASLFEFGVSPNKLLDYWAAGLPVLSNVGGATRSLVESVNGGVAVSHHGVADGLRQLMRCSSDERCLMGNRGRTWVAENRDRAEMTRRLQVLLDDLV